jgi:transposase
MRDLLGPLYEDQHFATLFPPQGQPAFAPWRLALVTIMQFAEGLSDRQAAEAVRVRLDGKYAINLELTDPGFDFSILSEFRTRLLTRGAESLLFETMLDHFKARGLLKARGQQRTDSTHVPFRHPHAQSLGMRRRDDAPRARIPGGCGSCLVA